MLLMTYIPSFEDSLNVYISERTTLKELILKITYFLFKNLHILDNKLFFQKFLNKNLLLFLTIPIL